MVFIKLQYKDNIKKILITKEEINWQKICEILHQIFKLEDSNSIRLVYKDDEENIGDIEIKSNQELLETINKKLIKKFIKFFVFYSGVVENDSDILYTSFANQNESISSSSLQKRKGSKNKKKSAAQKLNISSNDQLNQQKTQNNTTDIVQQSNNIGNENTSQLLKKEEINQEQKINTQKNTLIQVETQNQFKNILSKAINKSHVFEEIKDKVRLFISDTQQNTIVDENNNEQNKNNDKELELQHQKKVEEEIEYSIQTNLQQLSDLFVQNIREVIDEQLNLQLDLPSSYRNKIRKYSEDIFDKKNLQFKSNLHQNLQQEQQSPITSNNQIDKEPLIKQQSSKQNQDSRVKSKSARILPDEVTDSQNNDSLNNNSNSSNSNQNNSLSITLNTNNNLLQESIYTPNPQFESTYARNIRRKNTNNSDRMLEIIQEQEQNINNIEDNLRKTQKISEQQINQQFDKSFKSINHLFQSIHQRSNTMDNTSSESLKLQRNKTISAYELYLLLDKQVQSYSLPEKFKDDDSLDKDLSGPSVFDSMINEQITLKSKHQRARTQFFKRFEEGTKEDIVSQNFSEKSSPVSKEKINEEDFKGSKTQNNQKQLFENTIVQVVQPLVSFRNHQQQEKNDSKSMLQMLNTNHFNLQEQPHQNQIVSNNKQSNTNVHKKNNKVTKVASGSSCSPRNYSSQEAIDEVDDDQEFDSNLPKLIMTKKISHSIVQNV